MSVFTLCEQAIGLVRGKRLILSTSEKTLLEALDYEGLTSAHAQDEAVVCALHFERVQGKLLMMYPWKFARNISHLNVLNSGLNTWKYTAILPTDCVAVLGMMDEDNGGVLAEYEILDRRIHMNTDNAKLVYTSSVLLRDSTYWPAVFAEAFVSYLAAEIAPAVTGDFSAVEFCTKKAQQAITEARQLGLISSEITTTLQDDLKTRAINIARGQRTISATSEAAISSGLDVSGRANYRGISELQACIKAFDDVRDRLLELYPWVFAKRHKSYAFKEASISAWDYSHDLPADCVKVLALFSGVRPLDFDVSDGEIYTNAERPTLYYTAKVTSADEWPGIFRDVFCYELAAEILTATTGDIQGAQALTEKARLLIREAERTGAIQYETRRTMKQEIQKRAISLSRGQRSLTGTGNTAAEQGIDIAGAYNVRTNEEIKACSMAWESVRDRLLGLYPWTFARKNATLSTTTANISSWLLSYQKPDDCLKVLEVISNGEPVDYEEAGENICVNATSPKVTYTAQILDVDKWAGAFVDVYCYSLAQEIILATTRDVEAVQVLEQKAQSLIREAVKTGAIRYDVKIPLSEEIYNRAISLVRGQRTLSPTGNATAEQGLDFTGDVNYREREAVAVCRRSLPELRDKLLKMYAWKFARKSAGLTATSKKAGWDYAYTTPNDSMKILAVLCGDEPVEFEEADGLILCNATGNMTARYTRAITSLSELDAVFREVLCYELAEEISTALTWNSEQEPRNKFSERPTHNKDDKRSRAS